MQARILQRDADLIGEERKQSKLVRLECADAVACLAVSRCEHADDLIVAVDRHRNGGTSFESDCLSRGHQPLQISFGHRHIAE